MHQLVTLIAKYFIVLSVLGIVLVWVKVSAPEKKRLIMLAVLGAVLSLVFAKVGSKLYYDPRPFVVGHFSPYFAHGNDNGFPSDHTLLASFLAFTAWRFSRKSGIALLIIAVLIGLSRVIAGVHHLLDIVGSLFFAFIGVWIANIILDTVTKSKAQPVQDSQE